MASRRSKIKFMPNAGRSSASIVSTITVSATPKPLSIENADPDTHIPSPKSPVKRSPEKKEKTPETHNKRQSSPSKSPSRRDRSRSPRKRTSSKSPSKSVRGTDVIKSPQRPPPSSSPTKTKYPLPSPSPPRPTVIVRPRTRNDSNSQSAAPVPGPTSTALEIYKPPDSVTGFPEKLPQIPPATPTTPTRGPGIGPSLTPCRNSMVLHSVQKEIIGTGTNANITSNETLRQRLQSSTHLSTTKYAQVRKEFMNKLKQSGGIGMTGNGSKLIEKKDLTILHYTFWNPPKENEKGPGTGAESGSGDKDKDDFISELNRSRPRRAESMSSLPPKESETQEKNTSTSVGPRVKVGPDGELIIDEQSLIVETTASQRAKQQLQDMETVVSSASGMYRNKKSRRGGDWTVKETVRFYRALTQCGTDFSMMKSYKFPKRSRAELKSKYKREDRKNPNLISQALKCQSFDPTYVGSDEEETSEDEKEVEEIDLRDEEHAQKEKIGAAAGTPFTKTCESIEKHLGKKMKEISDVGTRVGTKRRKSKDKPQQTGPPLKRGRQKKLGQENLSFQIDDEDFVVQQAQIPDPTANGTKTVGTTKTKPKPKLPVIQELKLPPKKVPKRRASISTILPATSPVESSRKIRKLIVSPKRIVRPRRKSYLSESRPEIPEVLKFDPTDLLGLKIISTNSKRGQKKNSEAVADVNDSDVETFLIDAQNDKGLSHQVFQLNKANQNLKKSKGKAPPFRVPGGGPRHTDDNNSSKTPAPIFDDIEIEIDG